MIFWLILLLIVVGVVFLTAWVMRRDLSDKDRIGQYDLSPSAETNPHTKALIDRVARGGYLFHAIEEPAITITDDTMGSLDDWDAHCDATSFGLDFVNHVGTHLAFFMQWSIDNELFAFEHLDTFERAKNHEVELSQLPNLVDFKPFPHDFTEIGRAFAMAYYDQYLKDFYFTFRVDFFSVYNVPPTWENYERMAAVIHQRFEKWQQQEALEP